MLLIGRYVNLLSASNILTFKNICTIFISHFNLKLFRDHPALVVMGLSYSNTLSWSVSWYHFCGKLVCSVLSGKIVLFKLIFTFSYKNILVPIILCLVRPFEFFYPGNECSPVTILTVVVIFGNCFGAFASFVIEALIFSVWYSQIYATVEAADFEIVVFLLRIISVKIFVVFKIR